MNVRCSDFRADVAFSDGFAPEPIKVFGFICELIPGFRGVRRANPLQDIKGCDYWIDRCGLTALGVDLKLRKKDFSVVTGPKRADDLALEVWSDVGRKKVGWTRDPLKICDYILWYWKDTGRFFIVPFPPLCDVFRRNWRNWSKLYGPQRQTSRDGDRTWRSECVFVPRQVVVRKINEWMNWREPERKTA